MVHSQSYKLGQYAIVELGFIDYQVVQCSKMRFIFSKMHGLA